MSTIISAMITTMTALYIGNENKLSSNQERIAHKRWLVRRELIFRPMPRKHMLLSDIQLYDHFAGLLLKLGHRFFGLFNVFHQIGSNTILVLLLLSTSSIVSATKVYKNFSIQFPFLLPENNVNFTLEGALCSKIVDNERTLEHLCYMTNIDPGMVLVSDEQSVCSPETIAFLFKPTMVEFGTDNCTTNHICNDPTLFTSPPTKLENVGIRGVSGSTSAEEIGSIQFSLQDDEGKYHLITLSNIVYLPSVPKNLISISQ